MSPLARPASPRRNRLLVGTLALVAAACAPERPESAIPGGADRAGPRILVAAPAATPVASPARFRVRFETSKGPFTVEVRRDRAPRGADRLHELVTIGYFAGVRFYRMKPGFIAQFGIHGDPAVNAMWDTATIADDPIRMQNTRGTMAFAASGKNSRATELFINTGDNVRALDGQRLFAPFATVVDGMSVIDGLFTEYGEEPNHARIGRQGNRYLERWFPALDSIVSAEILPDAAR